MEQRGDLSLNISCSQRTNERNIKLPERMPDGRNIFKDPKLQKKVIKRHAPAYGSSNVFIPKHKLPVLDEFGLSEYKPKGPSAKISESEPVPRELKSTAQKRLLPQSSTQQNPHNQQKDENSSKKQEDDNAKSQNSNQPKRRKRKKPDLEPKIIPKEVREVAGGLPPSFPSYRIKKFTEEYHTKKKEERDQVQEPPRKKRTSFTPGLNPRRKEKCAHVFTNFAVSELEDLHPYLVSNLKDNFSVQTLTKIQSLAMPRLLHTRLSLNIKEFIINSGVGTGKILTYVTPIVNNLALLQPPITRTDGVHALVLLPTRELAAQVNDVFVKLCRSFTRIVPGLLTGGERKKSEKARLRKGMNILITTPGRLIDHMENSLNMDFRKLIYCVLGDAHRLLDPERAETSKKIAIILRKKLPQNCVKCVATSTLTAKLSKFLEIIMQKPVVIDGFKEFDDNVDSGEDDD